MKSLYPPRFLKALWANWGSFSLNIHSNSSQNIPFQGFFKKSWTPPPPQTQSQNHPPTSSHHPTWRFPFPNCFVRPDLVSLGSLWCYCNPSWPWGSKKIRSQNSAHTESTDWKRHLRWRMKTQPKWYDDKVVVSNILLFSTQTLVGNDPNWLAHIFQMAWNHQLMWCAKLLFFSAGG